MSTDPVERASDPATPLDELQFLAQNHPSLRPLIAENPSTYPALLEWLSEFSDPEIAAALQRRQNRINRATLPDSLPLAQALPQADSDMLQPQNSTEEPAKDPDESRQAEQTASPATAETGGTKTKSEKIKLADEADLDEFSPREEKTTSKKGKIFVIVIAIFIGLALSIGGNLADKLTGGDGSKGWYGKHGVIARVFGDSDLNKDHNNNGIPDVQENNGTQDTNNKSAGKSPNNGNNNAGAQLDVKTEGRQVAPAPTTAIGQAKGLPNGAYQVSEFSLPDAPIKCTIGNEVVCTAFSFTGNIGQAAGATVKFTLGAEGARTPEDLGVQDAKTSQTLLAKGAAAASGSYACQSSGFGVDCWNLQTGFGLKLTINSAEAYQPKAKAVAN